MGGGSRCIHCKKKREPDSKELFHRFPVRREEICRTWAIAARLSSYPTENQFLCSDHFKSEDYKFGNSTIKSKVLKEDAVPSVFAFTEERKPPLKRTFPEEADRCVKKTRYDGEQLVPSVPSINVSPSKEQLESQINELKKKLKVLQQKVRRQHHKIESLQSLVTDLKSKDLISNNVTTILEENFSGLSSDIILNHFSNKDRKNQGNRHSEPVKRFAMTLQFYSPRAYEYVKPIFNLPDQRSIRY